MTTIVLSATGAGTWTVPNDFNVLNNTVDVYAGGAGGDAVGGGGGGGAFSRSVNLTLTIGASINFSIGTGGAAATGGGDTWFGASSFPSSGQAVGAKGGSAPATTSGGAGGPAGSGYATGTGSFRNSGGAGGSVATGNPGGGGGGAGPNGSGNGGSNGGVSLGGAGGSGDVGFGGTGGVGSGSGGGGPGGNGTEVNPSFGSGGGGGGGVTSGGNAGNYGGGGGGGLVSGGTGTQGFIVIYYSPLDEPLRNVYVAPPPILLTLRRNLLYQFSSVDQGTIYYVNNSGSDSNNGTTQATAWQTITHVNAQAFKPGDQILFQSGQTFTATSPLTLSQSGVLAWPILFSTYGGTAPAILSFTSSVGWQSNQQYYLVNNLNFNGNQTGTFNSNFGGIYIFNAVVGLSLKGISFSNCDIGFFPGDGCDVESGDGDNTSSFTGLTFTGCNFHDCIGTGWQSYNDFGTNSPPNIFSVTITKCNFYNNTGSTTNGGSGLVLGAVNGATVQFCRTYNNGANATGGPVGMWTYNSQNVIFSFCESDHNKILSGTDGGGFDLDGGCVNCGFLYCYSHDNYGPGFQTFAFSGATTTNGNYYGFCISQNDASVYRSSIVFGSVGGSPTATFYNCTVFQGNSGRSIVEQFGPSSTTNFYNCIFYSNGAQYFFTTNQGTTNANFVGNDYFGSATWNYNGTVYSSFSAWQTATNQEKVSGSNVGLTSDPKLVWPGGGITIPNPGYNGIDPTAYRLQSTSSMIASGLDINALFSINPGTRDYYGTAIPYGGVSYNRGVGTALLGLDASGVHQIFRVVRPGWRW